MIFLREVIQALLEWRSARADAESKLQAAEHKLSIRLARLYRDESNGAR